MKTSQLRDRSSADSEEFLAGLGPSQKSEGSADFNLDYLIRVIKTGFEYMKILKSDFLFLKYYYNGTDGKLFRLNFVTDTLEEKRKAGKFSEEAYFAFNNIKENFMLLKNAFEWKGLKGFGPERLHYGHLIIILYKAAKIVEQVYLRQANYDEVKDFRADYLFYIEQDIIKLKPEENKKEEE